MNGRTQQRAMALRQAEQVLLALMALHVNVTWQNLPAVMERWRRCHALSETECPPITKNSLHELIEFLSKDNRCLCTCDGVRWYCTITKDYRLLRVLVRNERLEGKPVDPLRFAKQYPLVIQECGLKNACELCAWLKMNKTALVCGFSREKHSA